MHRIRRLNVSFELVCNNIPLIKSKYPLSLLYLYRGSRVSGSFHYTLLYIYSCVRLFQDDYKLYAGITLYDDISGYSLFSNAEPLIRVRNGTWTIGTHIPAVEVK